MTTTQTLIPPWPLSSEDGDWYALDGSLTRHQAASEIAYNLRDWYLDDHTWIDDEDNVHGWVTAYRNLLDNLKRGFIRPFEEGSWDDGEAGYWFECGPDHPFAVAAWVWKQE